MRTDYLRWFCSTRQTCPWSMDHTAWFEYADDGVSTADPLCLKVKE